MKGFFSGCLIAGLFAVGCGGQPEVESSLAGIWQGSFDELFDGALQAKTNLSRPSPTKIEVVYDTNSFLVNNLCSVASGTIFIQGSAPSLSWTGKLDCAPERPGSECFTPVVTLTAITLELKSDTQMDITGTGRRGSCGRYQSYTFKFSGYK